MEKTAEKSKYFDSFKVYIIKCWNEEEEFYKIGRTFKRTNNRFHHSSIMPYNYEIIKEIIGDAEEIIKLELKLKNEHKIFKYTPKLEFCGMHECYSKIKTNNETDI